MRALTELKKECFSHLNFPSKCLCCAEDKPRRLLLHHLSYSNDSVTYNKSKSCKFSNNDYGRLKYYAHLLEDEILDNVDNFIIVCFKCHKILEDLLKMNQKEVYEIFTKEIHTRKRFYQSYKMTMQKRGKQIDWVFRPKFLGNHDVYYPSFTNRINQLLSNPNLYDEYHEEMKERGWNEDECDMEYFDITSKLKEISKLIPPQFGYTFHEGDSILLLEGRQYHIGHQMYIDSELFEYLLENNPSYTPETLKQLFDDITWELDMGYFRKLQPKDEGQKEL